MSLDTPDDARLRRILREEVERLFPLIQAADRLMTIRQVSRHYHISYEKVRQAVLGGSLASVARPWGNRGLKARLIKAKDAEAMYGNGAA